MNGLCSKGRSRSSLCRITLGEQCYGLVGLKKERIEIYAGTVWRRQVGGFILLNIARKEAFYIQDHVSSCGYLLVKGQVRFLIGLGEERFPSIA